VSTVEAKGTTQQPPKEDEPLPVEAEDLSSIVKAKGRTQQPSEKLQPWCVKAEGLSTWNAFGFLLFFEGLTQGKGVQGVEEALRRKGETCLFVLLG
jgi:hypothetical protein